MLRLYAGERVSALQCKLVYRGYDLEVSRAANNSVRFSNRHLQPLRPTSPSRKLQYLAGGAGANRTRNGHGMVTAHEDQIGALVLISADLASAPTGQPSALLQGTPQVRHCCAAVCRAQPRTYRTCAASGLFW